MCPQNKQQTMTEITPLNSKAQEVKKNNEEKLLGKSATKRSFFFGFIVFFMIKSNSYGLWDS
jgi:hypothetical protein